MIMDSSSSSDYSSSSSDYDHDRVVLYHNIDRQLYARLAGDLQFDVQVSMKIVAFWNWLESCGYPDVVFRLLQLDNFGLYLLTKQAINCLYYLITGTELNPYASIESQTQYMPALIGAAFSHYFLYANRDIAMVEIGDFVENVGVPAFHDIAVLAPLQRGGTGLVRRLWATIVGPRISTNPRSGPDACSSCFRSKRSSMKQRTVYVSLSKTNPMSKHELEDFLFEKYGIRAAEMEANERFARVVMESTEAVGKIFEEEREVMLSVNGKQGLARRFVTMKEASDSHRLRPRPNKTTTAQIQCFFNTPRSTPSPSDLSFSFNPNPNVFYTLF